MSTTHFVYPSEYGRRILVRQVYLGKEHSFTALSAFTEMMNLFPSYGNSKNLSDLSGAEIHFSCRPFNEGFLFEGRLEQTQSSVLSYLFMNPYKLAEEMFCYAFENGPLFDEKKLAIIKERLLWKNSLNKQSSNCILDDLLLDEKELKEIKKENIDSLRKAIQSKEEGMILYVGDKKKENVYFLLEYQKQPTLSCTLKKENLISLDVIDEVAEFVFECKAIASYDDKELLYAVMGVIKEKARCLLEKIISIEFKIDAALLDNSHFALKVFTKNNKCKDLANAFLNVQEELKKDVRQDEIECIMKARKIEKKMNPDFFVDDTIESLQLNLNEAAQQDIAEFVSSISFVYERLVRKGE